MRFICCCEVFLLNLIWEFLIWWNDIGSVRLNSCLWNYCSLFWKIYGQVITMSHCTVLMFWKILNVCCIAYEILVLFVVVGSVCIQWVPFRFTSWRSMFQTQQTLVLYRCIEVWCNEANAYGRAQKQEALEEEDEVVHLITRLRNQVAFLNIWQPLP